MDLLMKVFVISLIYIFINTDIFFEYALKKINGTISFDNKITNKGEFIKYFLFIMGFIILNMV